MKKLVVLCIVLCAVVAVWATTPRMDPGVVAQSPTPTPTSFGLWNLCLSFDDSHEYYDEDAYYGESCNWRVYQCQQDKMGACETYMGQELWEEVDEYFNWGIPIWQPSPPGTELTLTQRKYRWTTQAISTTGGATTWTVPDEGECAGNCLLGFYVQIPDHEDHLRSEVWHCPSNGDCYDYVSPYGDQLQCHPNQQGCGGPQYTEGDWEKDATISNDYNYQDAINDPSNWRAVVHIYEWDTE